MFKSVLVSALFLWVAAPFAQADVSRLESPEAAIEVTVEQIENSDRASIADAILQNIDTAAIARFTLGRHGKSLDVGTRARFVTAFESYLRRQIVANADQIAGAHITITKTAARNARDAIVTTVVERVGDPLTLRWRVIERDGQWGVVDLEFAGVWLAIEQRAQVTALLDRPGADIESVIAQFN